MAVNTNDQSGGIAKSFNFHVYIDNKRIPVSRVSGIEDSVETDEIEEGGRNDKVYVTRKGTTSEHSRNTLVLERALPKNPQKDLDIKAGDVLDDEISLYLADESGKIYWEYHFMGCVIKRITIDGLDAGRSDVLMQRIEITYQSMEDQAFG
ncbi:MAG: phage tail protein [Roseburia sp.]